MKINVPAGQFLNSKLKTIYPKKKFIPFNEAMIVGEYTSKLFSESFMEERAKIHQVSIQDYKENLREFIEFLKDIGQYDEVVLWFGEEPFCVKNTEVVLQTLQEYNFQGSIFLNIVVEETGQILKSIKKKG